MSLVGDPQSEPPARRHPNRVNGRRRAGEAVLFGGLGVALVFSGAQALPASEAPGASLAEVHTNGPPPGHTGGFDEPTCLVCHSQYDLGVGGTLQFEGLPASYKEGEVYVVKLVLRSTEMRKAGFQASARFSSGDQRGRQAGTLRALDHRTAVIGSKYVPELQYIQHAGAGTNVLSAELATWTFEWTAPVGMSESVAFHASANSANADDSPLGDLVYAVSQESRPAPGGS